ncbi:hypothetical protein BDN70DRAFT_874774 [Pholiota conissans]|uniref:Uncharacterized protein n=1 Tax=Pholiota conissans TaxID=109636 RepID=A0A9P6CX57_9AGAR|nr:hypothetical protein BDN70DRAFT_874774 [Pholiota conissans]
MRMAALVDLLIGQPSSMDSVSNVWRSRKDLTDENQPAENDIVVNRRIEDMIVRS